MIPAKEFENQLWIKASDHHREVKRAVDAEREACAHLVEQYTGAWDDQGYALAQAIRARGER
jgi:hypothetical protein